MKSEHAIVESGEQATVERRAGRPTPKYVAEMRSLLEALDKSPTRCEACKINFASVVTGHPPMVICRGCSERARRSPLGRQQLRQDVARGGR